MPCSIFSNLPTVRLHQRWQLKLSGSHAWVWQGFPGKPLVGWYSELFETVLAYLLGSEAKCVFWLAWGFPHSCCLSPLPQHLWWLTVVPRLWEPVGNRLDACKCPHEHLPGQLMILTHCLQPPSAEVPMAAETEPGHLGGSASAVWTCLPAWVSDLYQCLCPSIPGVRGWLSHFHWWAITTWSICQWPAMELPSQSLAEGLSFSGFLLLCQWAPFWYHWPLR